MLDDTGFSLSYPTSPRFDEMRCSNNYSDFIAASRRIFAPNLVVYGFVQANLVANVLAIWIQWRKDGRW